MRRGIYILVIRGCFFLPAAKQTVRLLFFLRFLVVRFVLVGEHGLPALFGSVRLGIHLVIRFLVEVVVTFAIFPSASKQTAKQAALLRRFLRKMVVAEDVLIFLVLRLLGRRVVLLARAHRREQTGRIVRAELLLGLRRFRFLFGLFLRQTRCLGLRLFRRLGFRLGFFRGLGFCLGLLGGLRLGLFRGFQRGLLAHAPFASGQRLTLAILYGRIHLNAFVGVLFFHRNFLLPGNRQRRFGLLRAFHFLLGDRRFRFFKRRGRVLRILLHLGLGCHRFPGGFILLHRLRLVRVAGVSVFLVDFVVLRVLVLFVFLVLVGFLVRLARYEFAEAAEHSAERNAALRFVVFFVLVILVVAVLRVLAAGFGLVFLVLEIDRLAVLVGGLGAVRGGRFRRKIDRLRRLHGRLGIRFLLGFGFEGLRLLVGLKHAFVNALQIVFPVFLFFLLALEKRPEALKRGLLRLGGRFVRFAAAFLVRGLLGLAGFLGLAVRFLGLAVRFLFVGFLVLRGFTLPAGKLFLQTRAQTQNQRERPFLLFVGFLGVRLVLIEDFVLQLLLGVADLLALLLFQLRAHGTARLRRILRRFHRGLRGRHGVFQAALAARLNIALGRVVHLLPVGGFHGRGARARALCRRGLFRGRGEHGRGLLRGRSHPLSLTALLLVMQPLKFVKAHIRGSSPVFSCHL